MREALILVHLTPNDSGIAYDKWLMRQPLCTKRELEEYYRKDAEAKRRSAEAKSPRPKSGALPHNTEWL